MENNYNVYESRDKFLSLNPDLQIKSTLIHKSKFYNNDIGGYKLFNPITLTTFYLIHFIESAPEWKLITGYDKNFDSNAFFIPRKFVDTAAKETGPTIIVFLINNVQFYILPQQLQSFYRRNELEIKPNNEILVPVPIKLLRTEFPLHPKV